MIPVVGEVIESTVGKVVERLTDRWLPPDMSEQEKATLSLEAKRLAAQEWKTAAAELEGARTLAAEESREAPAWSRALAATHRPAWSFATLGFFSWTILAPYIGFVQMPLTELHKDVMQTVIIFYFGGRSIEKAVATVRGGL